MYIGIVLSQTPGYSETFFTSKIKGLQEAGFSVTLFVQRHRPEFTLCPVVVAPKVRKFMPLQLLAMGMVFTSLLLHLSKVKRFISLERNEGTAISEILKKVYLNAHLLKANLDWIHFGFATLAIGSECVAKAIGAKMGVSFRGFDINIYPIKHPNCYSTVWQNVDKVHSISKYLYEKAVGLGLPPELPHEIITPAVAIKNLPVDQKSPSETLQITTIARLNWIKGIEVALNAMKDLKDAGLSFQYHIIGNGTVKELERYKFQVYEQQLRDEVVFHGKLSHSETLKLLAATDIYVQSSLNEGFCNAVLEAQALGKLVIASNAGGLPENVVDEKTGWLFPVGDSEALAKKIMNVIKLSSAEKEIISDQAKQRVTRDFTIETQQQHFVSFYTEAAC